MKYFIALLLAAGCYAWNKQMENSGKGLYQGDMVLNPEQYMALSQGNFQYGSVTSGVWPQGKIPYQYESSLSSYGRQAMALAIADYHRYTCIRFSPRNGENYYISYFRGGGCYSPVGRQNGGNRVSIGSGCEDKGTCLHETAHSLGFLHEQSRPDRDSFIKINWGNIMSGVSYNFQKSSSINSLGSPYDLESMMHYSSTAFSSNGQYTIETLDSSKQHLINNYNRITGFSKIDIAQINKMYSCGGVQPTNAPTIAPSQQPTTCNGDTDTDCKYWATNGWCFDVKEIDFMKKTCCAACKTHHACPDSDQYCAYWASVGECTGSNKDWMYNNCRKSCGHCT